jgi:DNA end-binding protein Ku
MPARAYWSGNLRLALVSIPVQVYSATRSGNRIAFHQVHEPSGKRVRYQKIVPGIGPIDTGEIVKGYEVDKGKYVLLSDHDLDEIKLEAKKTIDLVQFVDSDAIDPIYFDRPYFVGIDDEDEAGGEAYVVLREALRNTRTIGLGQMVVRGKSQLVALKPCANGLLLESLRYADEVRKSDSFFAEVPDIKPEKELVDLAQELIGRKKGEFKPEAFSDSYSDALRELIDARLEDREPTTVEAPEAGGKVVDLMQALKQSVQSRKTSGQRSGKAASAAKGSNRRASSGAAKKKSQAA